jgi:DNA-binding NarL/FixJ family response regulator
VPVRVLVVDDHEMVAEGLASVLEAEDDLTVVARAATMREAVDKSAELEPDVVLIDYRLPDGDGVAASREIRTVVPAAEFVMMTSSLEQPVVSDAMEAGFCGFVLKSAGIEELVTAVRAAGNGEAHFSADALLTFVKASRAAPRPVDSLTVREREVLQAIAAGRGTGEIASQLYISQHTVRNHVRSILTKLDAHTKLEAVVIAARAGIVDFDAPA